MGYKYIVGSGCSFSDSKIQVDDGEVYGNVLSSDISIQQDYQIIQQLSEIIQDSGEIGEFNIGNLGIEIFNITTNEHELIICKDNLVKWKKY